MGLGTPENSFAWTGALMKFENGFPRHSAKVWPFLESISKTIFSSENGGSPQRMDGRARQRSGHGSPTPGGEMGARGDPIVRLSVNSLRKREPKGHQRMHR